LKYRIGPEVIIEPAFFNDGSFFTSLNEGDFTLIKLLVEQVRNNGISTTTIISNKKDRIGYFKIQFLPEFDTNGKVSNVFINTVPTTKAAYQKNTSNSSFTTEPSDNPGFNALAMFSRQLKLQDYFNDINSMDKSILNSIPADIAIFDLNHRYIFLNEFACPNENVRKWIIGKNDFEYCNKKKMHLL
jgi:hypothetical protein